MENKDKSRLGALSLKRQAETMALYDQMSLKLVNGKAIWSGRWRPTDLSDTYEIQVSYRFLGRPVISILSPKLELAKGKKRLPHVYKGGQYDICVHIKTDWHYSMRISHTIMPWISQWLYFYEVWLQTGEWIGKGTHPEWHQHACEAA
jgi:hypothetical protein